MDGGHVVMKDKAEGADKGVNTDFGQHAGKKRRNGNPRRMIGSRKPEEEWKHAGLDAESRHEQKRNRRQQSPGLMAQNLLVQMRHVQGACQTIEQRQPHEEQQGRQQIDDHVRDGAPELGTPLARRHEAERGYQHDFEPDIEVEQVPG